MPLEDNEAWIHPIKAIIVKEDKPGVPQSEAVYDSDHESSDEKELTAYQTLFGMCEETPGEAGHPSTPPPPPVKSDVPSPSPTQDLTSRFDAFWDKTQEHRVTMS